MENIIFEKRMLSVPKIGEEDASTERNEEIKFVS
jgi:hypothetical protein